MDKFFAIMDRFAPGTGKSVYYTVSLLRHVLYNQPIVRRKLTTRTMGLTERTVRSS
jgi:hypothetical protein